MSKINAEQHVGNEMKNLIMSMGQVPHGDANFDDNWTLKLYNPIIWSYPIRHSTADLECAGTKLGLVFWIYSVTVCSM